MNYYNGYIQEIDVDSTYDAARDENNFKKIITFCPNCNKPNKPFQRRKEENKAVRLNSGWYWRGISHKDYTITYGVNCKCGEQYKFKVYYPQ